MEVHELTYIDGKAMQTETIRIAVISDTHGLLRPEALSILHNVDAILHAGDVGDFSILEKLRSIAPVTAIRGNIDQHGDCARLPATELVSLGGKNFYLIHNLDDLDLNPEAAGIHAVLYGHTHQPKNEIRNGVLYFNPGSAGPRRFDLPVSLGFITITAGDIDATLKTLL
jgi:putative phosphoesterase